MLPANPKAFFDKVTAALFGHRISQSQVDGINTILAAWDKAYPNADLHFVACSLGNCYHETMVAMQPVREIGYGRGHAYGVPAGPWHQVYYGRGDIQLTWERNYEHATGRLHNMGVIKPTEDLVEDPDLALRPDISALILIVGMMEGWFTGKKLSDYLRNGNFDWVHSRQIVNGMDKAFVIAEYDQDFYEALTIPAQKEAVT